MTQWAKGPLLSSRAEMPWIPLYKPWQTNVLWLMDHPGTRAKMTCIPPHKTWQMNLLWPKNPIPPGYKRRNALDTNIWNFSDKTYFAQWKPQNTRAKMTCILLHKTWQMNLLWPMEPPNTRAKMTCILLHKTCQMNLLWPMDLPRTEQRCLAYQYTKLGRLTYVGW